MHNHIEAALPIWTVLKEMVKLELLTNLRFLLFGLSVFFGILGLYVPYAYLPALARNSINDLEEKDANFLLSIIGINSTVNVKNDETLRNPKEP